MAQIPPERSSVDRPWLIPALARATIDRAGAHRADRAWLVRTWADPRTRLLLVHEDAALVVGEPPELALIQPQDEMPDPAPYLLGADDIGAVFALDLGEGDRRRFDEPDEGSRWASLREVGALLSDRDAGLFTHAVALSNWHRACPRCPRCGGKTESVAAGAVRRCLEDGSEHHPRTDPAVIMTVVDEAGRVLLGHHSGWPPGRFSTLAGFVEPGESLEAAVAREVLEEVGVVVTDARYLSSQPWPFPSSIMLGFTARAVTTALHPDGEEIEQAAWFSREGLLASVIDGSLLLPPPVSIARGLIEHWYGSRLPQSG